RSGTSGGIVRAPLPWTRSASTRSSRTGPSSLVATSPKADFCRSAAPRLSGRRPNASSQLRDTAVGARDRLVGTGRRRVRRSRRSRREAKRRLHSVWLVRISVTHFTDPGCPWAYSASPALAVLRWRYGEQLGWRTVTVGLSEDPKRYIELGYTATRM